MTTRLSFFLLNAVLGTVTLAGTQGFVTYRSNSVVSPYEATEYLQKYKKVPALPDPSYFFRGDQSKDKSLLWRVHLALQLVKRPQMNESQVRIILDAISLSNPEFFRPAEKSKANVALESVRRRAVRAFGHEQAAELFGNIAEAKAEADILKMYYDISALPLKKRKASFRNVSSNVKSDLWRTHLALFLVNHPELEERQKGIILAAMSLATADFFEIGSNDTAWNERVRQPTRLLEEQIVNAFSLEDGAKIFATLGDETDLAKSSASVFRKSINYKPLSDYGLYKQWNSRFANQEMELERSACQCSTQSDWCHMSSSCSGSNCSPTQSGCGTMWSYPCNGASCQ